MVVFLNLYWKQFNYYFQKVKLLIEIFHLCSFLFLIMQYKINWDFFKPFVESVVLHYDRFLDWWSVQSSGLVSRGLVLQVPREIYFEQMMCYVQWYIDQRPWAQFKANCIRFYIHRHKWFYIHRHKCSAEKNRRCCLFMSGVYRSIHHTCMGNV